MPIGTILFYCLRALAGMLPVFLLWLLLSLPFARTKKIGLARSVCLHTFVFYILCLVWITVIRSGIPWLALFSDELSRNPVQLVPLLVTFEELEKGLWAFLYPLLGNIFWFVPFGVLLPLIHKNSVKGYTVFISALLCSVSIEVFQWIFATGISDIDDVIFNVSGAMLGYLGLRLVQYLWHRPMLYKKCYEL